MYAPSAAVHTHTQLKISVNQNISQSDWDASSTVGSTCCSVHSLRSRRRALLHRCSYVYLKINFQQDASAVHILLTLHYFVAVVYMLFEKFACNSEVCTAHKFLSKRRVAFHHMCRTKTILNQVFFCGAPSAAVRTLTRSRCRASCSCPCMARPAASTGDWRLLIDPVVSAYCIAS